MRRSTAGAFGIAGPVIFTAAWVAAGAATDELSARRDYISDLAAVGVDVAPVMIAGFAAGGACIAVLGREVRRSHRRLGTLLAGTGVALAVDGFLRHDCVTSAASCSPSSWHSNAHDGLSLLLFLALVAAPFVAARPAQELAGPRARTAVLAVGALGVVLLGLVAAEPWPDSVGLVQRVFVVVVLGFVAAIGAAVLADGRARDDAALRAPRREATMAR